MSKALEISSLWVYSPRSMGLHCLLQELGVTSNKVLNCFRESAKY